MGNHTFDRKEIAGIIDDPRLLRPANYPPTVAGHGSGVFKSRSGISVGVLQLMGRIYMPQTDSPFQAAERELEKLKTQAKVIFVDLHAEITSEKAALAWYMDGTRERRGGNRTPMSKPPMSGSCPGAPPFSPTREPADRTTASSAWMYPPPSNVFSRACITTSSDGRDGRRHGLRLHRRCGMKSPAKPVPIQRIRELVAAFPPSPFRRREINTLQVRNLRRARF